MKYRRMPIEEESPEQLGYDKIRYNLTESSVRDRSLSDLGIEVADLLLFYGDHAGHPGFRELIAAQSGAGVTVDDVLVTAGAAAGALHHRHVAARARATTSSSCAPTTPPTSRRRAPSRPTSASSTSRSRRASRIDPDKLMALVTPRTKYVSITVPHNPTGQ